MTLLIIILTYALLGGGALRLYQHFSVFGSPQSLGEVLNTQILTSLFIIAVSLGLILRKSWGRIAASGLMLYVVGATVVFIGYSIANFRQLALAAVMSLWIFQKYLVFVQNMAVAIATAVIALLISAAIMYLALKQLSSDRAKEFYGDTLWFGRELSLSGFDLRPLLFAILFAGCAYFDQLAPKKLQEKFQTKNSEQSQKALEAELMKDPAYQEQKRQEDQYRRQKVADSIYPEEVKFTDDGMMIWIVMSDQQVYLIDLKTYKLQKWKLKSSYRHDPQALAADGSAFFDHGANSIIATKSGQSYQLSGRDNTFVGFAPNLSQAIFFSADERAFKRVDYRNQQVLWRTEWKDSKAQWGNGFRVSADRRVVLIQPGDKQFFLLNTESGEILPATFEFRYAEFNHWLDGEMVLSGPAAYGQFDYRSYRIRTSDLSVVPIATTQALLSVDPIRKIYWARPKSLTGKVEWLNVAAPELTRKEVDINTGDTWLHATGRDWSMKVQMGFNQIQFENFESKQKVRVGKNYDDVNHFAAKMTKAAMAPSGMIWVVVNRKQAEVFWLSEIEKPTPRTWAIAL